MRLGGGVDLFEEGETPGGDCGIEVVLVLDYFILYETAMCLESGLGVSPRGRRGCLIDATTTSLNLRYCLCFNILIPSHRDDSLSCSRDLPNMHRKTGHGVVRPLRWLSAITCTIRGDGLICNARVANTERTENERPERQDVSILQCSIQVAAQRVCVRTSTIDVRPADSPQMYPPRIC